MTNIFSLVSLIRLRLADSWHQLAFGQVISQEILFSFSALHCEFLHAVFSEDMNENVSFVHKSNFNQKNL